MKHVITLPLCFLFISICCIHLHSQDLSCESKIIPFDGVGADDFGFAVDGCGDLLVVGAHDRDDNGQDSGSAYLYAWDGSDWIVTKITASDGADFDSFGYSVSCSNNRVLIGSYRDDISGQSNVGSAYLYDWNGASWIETKITASDGSSGDNYGRDVSIDGTRMIIGSPFDDISSTSSTSNSGSAYVYDWNGTSWIETKLVPLVPEGTANFGRAVAINGDRIVIGSWADDINGNNNSGSAYIFDWNGSTWVETKIYASDGSPYDHFGWSVSVSGDHVVIGAKEDDDNGVDSGSAYFYNWNGSAWVETKVKPSDGSASDRFGESIDVSSDRVIVGAINHDMVSGVETGSAYVYDWDGTNWVETKITASDGAHGDDYGSGVTVFGNRIAVGAHRNDVNGISHGSTYIYGPSQLIYMDADNDGFGNPNNSVIGCLDQNYVLNNLDCDDSNAAVNPDATEICNGIDDNCSLQIDDTTLCLCPNGFQTNTFIGGSIFWTDASNWSLGTVPTLCDHVIIPPDSSVIILSTESGECFSLQVDPIAVFEVELGGVLDVVAPGY